VVVDLPEEEAWVVVVLHAGHVVLWDELSDQRLVWEAVISPGGRGKFVTLLSCILGRRR